VRDLLGLRPAPEFAAWLESRQILRNGKLALDDGVHRRMLESAKEVLTAA